MKMFKSGRFFIGMIFSQAFYSFPFIFLVCMFLFFQPSTAIAQKNDSISSIGLRNQIGIATTYDPAVLIIASMHYRRFIGKRTFCDFGVEGFYNDHVNANIKDFNRIDLTTWGAMGVSYPFFKVFRWNMALQLSTFISRIEGTTVPENYNYNRKLSGLFLGPAFELEFDPVKSKKFRISAFSKIHLGFGYMKWEYNHDNPGIDDTYKGVNYEKNSIGSLYYGLRIKF